MQYTVIVTVILVLAMSFRQNNTSDSLIWLDNDIIPGLSNDQLSWQLITLTCGTNDYTAICVQIPFSPSRWHSHQHFSQYLPALPWGIYKYANLKIYTVFFDGQKVCEGVGMTLL